MADCADCGTKLGFLSYYVTARGKICGRCKKIETLTTRLGGIMAEEDPLVISRALKADPRALKTAGELVSLDPSPRLFTAIACGAIEAGEDPKDLPPEAVRAAHLRLFEEEKDPKRLFPLIESGGLDEALAAAAGSGGEVRSDWLEFIERAAGAGRRTEALSLALGLKGAKTPALLSLIAGLSEENDLPEIVEWVETARFVSLKALVAFMASFREKFGNTEFYSDLLTAAYSTLEGSSDEVALMAHLGDIEGLKRHLESQGEISSNDLASLAILGEKNPEEAFDLLLHHARPSPLSKKILALGLKFNPARGFELAVRLDAWEKARELGEKEGRTAELEVSCRKAMATAEEALLPGIGRAIGEVVRGRRERARDLLSDIARDASARAPLARLSSLLVRALLEVAELDAAARLVKPMELLAKKRARFSPLSDAGLVAGRIPILIKACNDAAERFLSDDTHPFFVIPLALPDLSKDLDEIRAEVSSEEEMIEAAGSKAETGLTESSLLASSTASIFIEALLASAGRESPSPDEALLPVYRSIALGIIGNRLLSPLAPGGTHHDWIGPRDLGRDYLARAVAFLPADDLRSTKRWETFVARTESTLRHLGINTTAILPLAEAVPSWHEIPPAPGVAGEASPVLPPLGGTRSLSFDDIYNEKAAGITLERAGRSDEGPLGF